MIGILSLQVISPTPDTAPATLRDRMRALLLRIRGRHYTPHYIISFYFNTVGLLSRANYPRYRWLTRWPSPLKLHLGCGPIYIPGWVNFDGLLVWKTDAFLDIRAGLPFADNTVEGIYTCHTLEHFYFDQLLGILREMHRVLKPGAAFRIVVPSLEKAIDAYVARRAETAQKNAGAQAEEEGEAKVEAEAKDRPKAPSRHGDFHSRGAHFNWETLCDNQHPIMLDFTLLSELLQSTGTWTDLHETGPQRSIFMSPTELETAEGARVEYIGASLVVEGRKAGPLSAGTSGVSKPA
ncbi:MAG: methyltransferase domain-containing protein [Candidatus Methylacidiphilales bacterium]|nr:methyltransferase domain-containing protein [Candidatus Methylacidiphilales bacterium]